MNTRNACGFLSFGFVMMVLPVLMPDWFPPTGFDGTSARAMWLEFMGGVQALLGTSRVVWHAVVPAVVGWLAPAPVLTASVTAFPAETPALPIEAEFEIERQAEAA